MVRPWRFFIVRRVSHIPFSTLTQQHNSMFPVGRYDPKKKDHNSNGGGNPKGNKRRRKGPINKNGAAEKDGRDSEQPKSSLLRVIAPDETANLPFASSRMAQPPEAVDDFALFPLLDSYGADIDDGDVIEVDDVAMVGTAAATSAATTTSTPTTGQAENLDEDRASDDSDDDDHDDQMMMIQNNKAVSVGQASPGEIKAALKIASLGLEHAAKIWKLAPFLVNNLKRDGFQHFFPIQALSIPDVIASERHYHVQAQDVCITAPTGSGKTLAFVLPVLNALADRQVCRLRALIVLPSRDLANQVYRVFESYVQGSNLKVGLAIGQSDFTAEQVAITVGDDDDNDQDKHKNKFDTSSDALQRLRFDPGNLELTLRAYRDADSPGGASTGSSANNSNSSSGNKNQALKSGQSAVDILVCTPGRLVDHLDNTKGFTLQHLRFLVVDEADRLLNQSYHNWIGRVIDAASEASVNAWHEIEARGDNRLAPVIPEQQHDIDIIINNSQVAHEPITWRRGGTAGDYSDFDANANSYFCPASLACRPVQLRKFLVSATLTRDPQKLASLRLVNPKHFDVHQLNMLSSSATGNNSDPNKSKQQRKQQFSVPIELEEFMVECTAEQKPIVLLSLLIEQLQKSKSFMPLGDVESTHTRNNKRQNNVIVVFTASVDSTHRLARLLQLIWPSCTKLQEVGGNGEPDGLLGAVVEFSSALSQAERSALIQRCNDNSSSSSSSSSQGRDKNDISIVVCSDSMARGMDIEKCGTVINYDVPTLAKTYLHRVGRTARAGKSGVAISLLKSGQVSQFTRMRRLIHSPSAAAQVGNNRNSNSIVPTMDISKSIVRQLVPMYRNCIRGLKDVLEAEENGELAHTEPLSEEYFETSSA